MLFRSLESVAQLIAPFAPHIAEELWEKLGHKDSIHVGHWPVWDDSLTREAFATIILQVNGKMRATISVPKNTPESKLTKLARAQVQIKKYLKGHSVTKTIVLKDRLVNFVIS